MSTDRQQSAIAEVRDQLSLDYADDKYLNVVAANLGMTRPPLGFNDDTWRAVVKLVALHYKQISTKFAELFSVILGPQTTQVASLRDASQPDTRVFELNGTAGLPQRGILVFDEGQASEETLEYSFVDRAENLLYVNDLPSNAHAAISADAEQPIMVYAAAGSGSITISRGFEFPTEYPYTVVLGRGTTNEEAVVVTSITGNVATLAGVTVNDHLAPIPSAELTTLTQPYFATSNYVILDESSKFPDSGYVVLRGATDEVVEYTSIDRSQNMLIFADALVNAFPAGSVVELLDVQETMATAPIQVKGVGWELWQVEPRKLEVYLPPEVQDINTVRTAAYLHKTASSPAVSTTLTANVSPGDTTLTVTSTASFPAVGVFSLGAERFGYSVTSGTVLTLANGSTMALSHLIGATVSLYEPVHAGTDLLNGSLWTVADTFPGGYLYDNISAAPTNTVTTLNQKISGPVEILLDVPIGNTAVEVADATAFELASFPYSLRLGEYTSAQEDVQVSAVHLKSTLSEAVTATPGGNQIGVAALTAFPTAAGYRVRIGRGTANEEVAYVLDYDISTGTFTFSNNLVNAHALAELVELVSDTVTITPASRFHIGAVAYGSRTTLYPVRRTDRPVEAAAPVYTSLTMTTTTGFSADGGRVILNFGRNRVSRKTSLVSNALAGATSFSCVDTDAFPTTYPFAIVVNRGGFTEETLLVSNNNTGTDVLTVSAARLAHLSGEPIDFLVGDEFLLEYDELAGANIELPATTMPTTLWAGTAVHYSDVDSVPDSQGYDFAFRMPVDIRTRLQYLIDLIRAAGVQVTFIDQR